MYTPELFSFQNIGIFGGFRLVPNTKTGLQEGSKETLAKQRRDFDDLAKYLQALV